MSGGSFGGGSGGQVSLAPGSSVALTGLIPPADQSTTFAFTTTFANDQVNEGNGFRTLAVNGCGTAKLYVSGSGTAAVYVSYDGSTFIGSLKGYPIAQSNESVDPTKVSLLSSGAAQYDIQGAQAVQVRSITGTLSGKIVANGIALPPTVQPVDPRCLDSSWIVSAQNISLPSNANVLAVLSPSASPSLGKLRITKIVIEAFATTATYEDLVINRRSALTTGGTTVAMKQTKCDTGDSFDSDTLVANTYSAVPALNGTASQAGAKKLFLASLTASGPTERWTLEYGGRNNDKELLIGRAAGEQLTIERVGAPAVPSGTVYNIDIHCTNSRL